MSMEAQHNQDEEYREQARHVPLVEFVADKTLVSEKQALQIWHDLEESESQIPSRAIKAVDQIELEILPELEQIPGTDSYVVTPTELYGVLSKVAIRATSQTVRDIGEILKESHDLEDILASEPEGIIDHPEA